MATQMIPDPSAARGPSPSQASVKIVGNMIELNSPTASSDQPDTAPTLLAGYRQQHDHSGSGARQHLAR